MKNEEWIEDIRLELDCIVLSIVWDFDFIIYICLFEKFKDFKNKVIVVLYLII